MWNQKFYYRSHFNTVCIIRTTTYFKHRLTCPGVFTHIVVLRRYKIKRLNCESASTGKNWWTKPYPETCWKRTQCMGPFRQRQRLFLFHYVQMSPRTHSAFYPMGIRHSFVGSKVDKAMKLITIILCQG